jgi:hypothetical protein
MNDLEALAAELVKKLSEDDVCYFGSRCTQHATCKECETSHILVVLKALIAMGDLVLLALVSLSRQKEVKS